LLHFGILPRFWLGTVPRHPQGVAVVITILAYFDPGPGSLLLQVLVGGAAGLVVFGKYVWDSAIQVLRKRRRSSLQTRWNDG
jgi:hypothetical protein